MAVLGEVAIIMVRGEDWLLADKADQRQYELTAGERGIVLVKEGGNGQKLEVVREVNRSRSIEAVPYDGVVGCSRAPWEHALRRILDLSDPCFEVGGCTEPPGEVSYRASGSVVDKSGPLGQRQISI